MNQQKIGEFLKRLRKERGMTQEELAEHFSISSRTVSRWETGSNVPDVEMLIELADFYDLDIREIIDGERKSEKMDRETKDTLKKVAAYAEEKEKAAGGRIFCIALGIALVTLLCTVLFIGETRGILYGIVPEGICNTILAFTYVIAAGLLISYLKVRWAQEKPTDEPEKSVMATVVSKEVKQGTQSSGRSVMGYSFAITFLTEDGQKLELYAYDYEYGALTEGAKGMLTHKGRYFVGFHETA